MITFFSVWQTAVIYIKFSIYYNHLARKQKFQQSMLMIEIQTVAALESKSLENGDCFHHALILHSHEWPWAGSCSAKPTPSQRWHRHGANKTLNNRHPLCFQAAGTCLQCTWELLISQFKVKMASPLFKMSWHVICCSTC